MRCILREVCVRYPGVRVTPQRGTFPIYEDAPCSKQIPEKGIYVGMRLTCTK
jgi:hypothetical protein